MIQPTKPTFPKPADHQGRVYIVTGASSGIGKRIAELLHAEGAKLVLADISENLSDVAKTLDAQWVVADLSDPGPNADCVSLALEAYGQLDGAVMAAGVVNSAHLADTSAADFQRVLEINVLAPFHLTKAMLPSLRGTGRGPSLVYVGSKDAFDVVPGVAAYSVSKAALLQLAKTVAIEEGRHGIRANVLHPDVVLEGSGLWGAELRANRASHHGVSADDLARHYSKRNALGVALSADDMAYAVSFLLSRRAAAVSGAVLTVDGGYGPAFPR